ncbi:MAG: hypothetical protein ACI9SE_004374, partial [Neolewinella sp.]
MQIVPRGRTHMCNELEHSGERSIYVRNKAVETLQRFDSALRLNVHLHVLWLDGCTRMS